MRLLCTFNNEKEARFFSLFLTKKRIENQLEISSNTDWGSADYGTITGKVWIIDEDKVKDAEIFHTKFLEEPNDPIFKENLIEIPSLLEEKIPLLSTPEYVVKEKPIGLLTMYIILTCTLIFFYSLVNPGVIRALQYDYPASYVIMDKVVNVYGLKNENELPPEAGYLIQQYHQTPVWTGLYDKIVMQIKTGSSPAYFNAPLFEKIQEGEFWRLVTPIFLHGDLLHLFFNVIWMLILGKQMEERLGTLRLALFIVIAAIFSNTSQYMMSGFNFMGLSGVVCAMITFIWFRQKKAVWEGYQLLPMTMGFITLFVLALVGIQLFFFILEIQGTNTPLPRIANTAHLSGALIGYLLSKPSWFARR